MDNNFASISWKIPHTLTIIPTYKCTAACHNCCFQSNPSITKRVPQEKLLNYIRQASELGSIQLVCFSGGEPFVLGKDLVELVQACSDYGFMTRIVTNGYWATSKKAARLRLAPLVEAGLSEINFSTGDDHVEFVPLERVLQGLESSLEFSLGAALMIEETENKKLSKEVFLKTAEAYPSVLSACQEDKLMILESPWMEFAPEAEKIKQKDERLANKDNLRLREPCKSVLTTVVVTPDEQLGLCCGLPREQIEDLHGGSLREKTMKEIVDSTRFDFLKIWLFVEGPERILAWAASKDPSIEWENKYAHNCDACRAMYLDDKVLAVIGEHYEEKLDEVMMSYSLYVAGQKKPELEAVNFS